MTENGTFFPPFKSNGRLLRRVITFKTELITLYKCTELFIYDTDFYLGYFWRYEVHKNWSIVKIFNIFHVWIDLKLARLNQLVRKLDMLKFRNVRIYWFMSHNYNPHSSWDIGLTRNGLSGRVESHKFIQEKDFSRFASS